MSKIVILGAGHVGSLCTLNLAMSGICGEIALIDIDEGKADSQAKDIADATAFMRRPVKIYAGTYADCGDADILVISVGVSRKPGQTRLDMLGDTIDIMKDVVAKLSQTEFNGIIISISNPCDIVVNYARKHLDYPAGRIFGTGTSLDTARLRRTLHELTGVDMRSIQCFAMGEHGDSSMVPFSHITLMGKPLTELIEEKPEIYGKVTREILEERTHQIGMEIIIGKGSTEFGIGAALAELCQAVLYDERRVFPVSAYLAGEYGKSDFYAGVPAVIGRNGVEEILSLKLTEPEQAAFDASCAVIQEHNRMAEAR